MIKQNCNIILASASPRRKELFAMTGLEFEVRTSNAPEKKIGEDPAEIVQNIARQKAKAVAASADIRSASVIVGADTVVVRDNDILGKPVDKEDAFEMLSSLRNRTHTVFTGVCAFSPDSGKPVLLFSEETLVEFCDYTDSQIHEYIKSGEPMDKAGSYAIQGLGCFMIRGIRGDYHNVMGFPIGRFLREALRLGWIEII